MKAGWAALLAMPHWAHTAGLRRPLKFAWPCCAASNGRMVSNATLLQSVLSKKPRCCMLCTAFKKPFMLKLKIACSLLCVACSVGC